MNGLRQTGRRPIHFGAPGSARWTGAGVPYRRNAFRNSYISYRLAILQDIRRVAEETGTSPEMIRQELPRADLKTVAEDGLRYDLLLRTALVTCRPPEPICEFSILICTCGDHFHVEHFGLHCAYNGVHGVLRYEQTKPRKPNARRRVLACGITAPLKSKLGGTVRRGLRTIENWHYAGIIRAGFERGQAVFDVADCDKRLLSHHQ